MIVTVQELGKSSGGKPKCKANNVWYFLPTDKDTGEGPSPLVGQVVEIRTGSFEAGGKTFQTIEAWRPKSQDSQNQQSQPSPQAQQQRPAAPIDTSQAFIGQGFISNVVGQAINAKTITEPGQILAWFNAAKNALEGKPAAEPFSDPLPAQQQANSRW